MMAALAFGSSQLHSRFRIVVSVEAYTIFCN